MPKTKGTSNPKVGTVQKKKRKLAKAKRKLTRAHRLAISRAHLERHRKNKRSKGSLLRAIKQNVKLALAGELYTRKGRRLLPITFSEVGTRRPSKLYKLVPVSYSLEAIIL